jgi:hypothetical protein
LIQSQAKERQRVISRFIRLAYRTGFALLILGLPVSATGQPASSSETSPLDIDESTMEEVLVLGVDDCGAWPVAHHLALVCYYAVLKQNRLNQFRKLRARKFVDCLVCKGPSCSLRELPSEAKSEKLICTRLFTTPKRLARLSVRDDDSELLIVDYRFDVSSRGRIENVQITYLDSDLSEEAVWELLNEGIKKTRYEPLRFNGSTFELIDLEDGFILERY